MKRWVMMSAKGGVFVFVFVSKTFMALVYSKRAITSSTWLLVYLISWQALSTIP